MAFKQSCGISLGASLVAVLVLFSMLLINATCAPPTAPPAPPTPPTPPPSPAQPPAPPPPAAPPAKWSADGVISAGEYTKVSTYGDYEINWASDQKHIYVGMKAKTTGWIAVGIQPGSQMKNADMVLGFVKEGKAAVYDQFSTDVYGPHRPDTELGGSDDILEFGGKEEGGYTTIEFKRGLKTGDKYDHQLFKGVNKIIWAYGAVDQLTLKHTDRGYGEIDLETGEERKAPADSDTQPPSPDLKIY